MREADPPRLLMLAVGMGTGGAEALIRDSLRLLRLEGFEVTLRSLKDGGAGMEAILRGGEPAPVFREGRRLQLAPLGRLLRHIRQGRFDLIHSHLFWANLAARTVGRWAGIPVILNSHHGTDGWLPLSHRLLERSTVGLADRVVVCSEAVRRCAVEEVGLPASKVVVIPNGIPAERFADRSRREAMRASLGLDAARLAVGSVGRLDEPVKGFSVLVEAMGRVAARRSDAVCLVAGDGPARRGLEETVRRSNLSESVKFLGERRDIPEFLQALDLYVQPSRLEGFGLSALEAMATGLPVVASRTGGLPEVVQEGITGELVPPGDAGSLADTILALLADPTRRAAYGRSGEAIAREEFPLEKMVRAWANLYRTRLAEKGRRAAA
ncbi:MAG: glycosyl transferase [Acidobacteria bacterium]|nr:MAG: glycosyl transferase [Acidobacteriota bacterium]